jgi:hypothetical protein
MHLRKGIRVDTVASVPVLSGVGAGLARASGRSGSAEQVHLAGVERDAGAGLN